MRRRWPVANAYTASQRAGKHQHHASQQRLRRVRAPSVCSWPVCTAQSWNVCALEPDRAARFLVDKGSTRRFDSALETLKALPYDKWRDYDPEDTLRFYALRLHEVGMIKSIPQKIIRGRL